MLDRRELWGSPSCGLAPPLEGAGGAAEACPAVTAESPPAFSARPNSWLIISSARGLSQWRSHTVCSPGGELPQRRPHRGTRQLQHAFDRAVSAALHQRGSLLQSPPQSVQHGHT